MAEQGRDLGSQASQRATSVLTTREGPIIENDVVAFFRGVPKFNSYTFQQEDTSHQTPLRHLTRICRIHLSNRGGERSHSCSARCGSHCMHPLVGGVYHKHAQICVIREPKNSATLSGFISKKKKPCNTFKLSPAQLILLPDNQ